MGVGWSVFLSHSSDMAAFPASRSFVQAAVDAVLKAGHRPIDMAYFSARDGKPAAYCEQQVGLCDVYVGLIGFRYGSLVPDAADPVSYTELEYRAAVAAGKPRLVFILGEDAPVPRRLVDRDGTAIDAFRETILGGGLLVETFDSPGGLQAALLHALAEMERNQQNATAGSSDDGRPSSRGVWMVPALTGRETSRPGLEAALEAALTAAGSSLVGVTTAVEGGGGFGKTTLAQMVCHHPDVRARFPGGVLWTTVGEATQGAGLAGLVNALCETLTGERPTTTDPAVAGALLGTLLDEREAVLLVVDDVWRAEQLDPFTVGGKTCRRLVTTRNRGVVRGPAAVLVDRMTTDEADQTLERDLDAVPVDVRDRLVELTGRWPVLLGLVNAALVAHVEDGATTEQAARLLARQLETSGPVAVDEAAGRGRAVATTMAASMQLLDAADRDRYHELAIFPEDVDIPIDVLGMYWAATGGLDATATGRLRDQLVRLRLAQGRWSDDVPALQLHDVIRAFLRHWVGGAEHERLNAVLLDAATAELPSPIDGATPAWWRLRADGGRRYLWRNLVTHLIDAGRGGEAVAVASDLRWIAAKIRVVGGAGACEADLAPFDTTTATALRQALAQTAHMLVPGETPETLGATLVSRLEGVSALEDAVRAFRHTLPSPRLENRWPLPDKPRPALLRTLTGHRNSVAACTYSPDGSLLASASDDGTVRLWTSTGQPRATLATDSGVTQACGFSPDGSVLATGGAEGTIKLWDVATGRPVLRLDGHAGRVRDCEFSPDGLTLVSVGDDQTVRVWDTSSGLRRTTLTGHGGPVYSCSFSPDGGRIATASADGTVRVWNTVADQPSITMSGHTGTVYTCTFSPDGLSLATGGEDGVLTIWDSTTGRPTSVLREHSRRIVDCAFSRDGRLLATASKDGTVRVRQLPHGKTQVLTGHTSEVRSCSFSADGSNLVTSGNDMTVRIWGTTNYEPHAVAPGDARSVFACAFSPDGEVFATVGDDRKVRLWDTTTGTSVGELARATRSAFSCAWSSDGELFATGGSDGTAQVWTKTGELRTALAGHTGWIFAVAFSPDGKQIATSSDDHTVRVWDATTGHSALTVEGHASAVFSCVFSPDGRLLASASSDRTVRLTDTATGRCRTILTGNGGPVYGCSFSPDSSTLATISDDGAARMWDTSSGTLLITMNGHAAAGFGCDFSPDGGLLATVGGDRSVRIWHLDSGRIAAALSVAEPLYRCSWHPDATTLGMVGAGGVYLMNYVR